MDLEINTENRTKNTLFPPDGIVVSVPSTPVPPPPYTDEVTCWTSLKEKLVRWFVCFVIASILISVIGVSLFFTVFNSPEGVDGHGRRGDRRQQQKNKPRTNLQKGLRGVKEDGFPDIDHFGIQTGLPKRNTLPEEIADDTKSSTTTFKWPLTRQPVPMALRPSPYPRGQPGAKKDGLSRHQTGLKLPDVSADAQPKVPCPSDWMQHGDRCYLFIPHPVHFTNITEYCSEEGGSPAVLLKDDEGTFEKFLVSGARPILECCLNEKGKRDARPKLLQRLDDDLIKFIAKFSTKWPQEEDDPKPEPNNRIIPRHLLLRKGVTATSPTILDIAAVETSSSFIQTTDSMQTNIDNGGLLDGGSGLINHETAYSTSTTTTTLSTSSIFAETTTSSSDSEFEVPVSGDKNTDQSSTLGDVTRNQRGKNKIKNAKELPIFNEIQEQMCKSSQGAYMDDWLSVDCNVGYLQVCVKG